MRFLPIATCAPLFLLALARPYQGGRWVGPRQEEPEDNTSSFDESCGVGYCSINGATVGGWGGNYTNVTTLEEFSAAVSTPGAGVIIVNGNLTGNARVTVGSSKSILGWPGSSLTGIALHLKSSRNVILRNLRITRVPPTLGDAAIAIENGRSIWVDHCDISSSSPSSSFTNYNNSLLSITHGSDYITITNNILHTHPSGEAATIGHSDANTAEDKGKLHVTLAGNHIHNVKSAISFRFGTGHVLNSLIQSAMDGVNTRMGADLLIESVIFEDVSKAVFSAGSAETGYATIQSVLVGEGVSSAPQGNMTAESLPYPYDWYVWDFYSVRENIKTVGQTLHWRQLPGDATLGGE